MLEARVCSHDGPIRRRKRGYQYFFNNKSEAVFRARSQLRLRGRGGGSSDQKGAGSKGYIRTPGGNG
eukprot:1176419-Prorocentrum_minimum.AAC.1